VRVVGGRLGGRRLAVPRGGVRPTTSRVREALFASLEARGLVVDAVVVDLFAGSGALGIEALSRGARSATFVERNRAVARVLRRNLAAVGLLGAACVEAASVERWPGLDRPVDLVLADPPYDWRGWDDLLARLAARVVAAETDRPLDVPPGWRLLQQRPYGTTVVTLMVTARPEGDGQ